MHRKTGRHEFLDYRPRPTVQSLGAVVRRESWFQRASRAVREYLGFAVVGI